MSQYRYPEPSIPFVAEVRDHTDRVVREPEHRGKGHGAARERAIGEVLAGLLSVERESEGQG